MILGHTELVEIILNRIYTERSRSVQLDKTNYNDFLDTLFFYIKL